MQTLREGQMSFRTMFFRCKYLAKSTIAAEVDLGTPAAVYGALISILSIEERSRDRAITAIARNKAIKSGEPFKYNIPLITAVFIRSCNSCPYWWAYWLGSGIYYVVNCI